MKYSGLLLWTWGLRPRGKWAAFPRPQRRFVAHAYLSTLFLVLPPRNGSPACRMRGSRAHPPFTRAPGTPGFWLWPGRGDMAGAGGHRFPTSQRPAGVEMQRHPAKSGTRVGRLSPDTSHGRCLAFPGSPWPCWPLRARPAAAASHEAGLPHLQHAAARLTCQSGAGASDSRGEALPC